MVRTMITRSVAALALMTIFTGATLVATDAKAWHGNRNSAQAYDSLAPENQSKYDAIMKSYNEKMAPLTEKMMAKRMELDALSGNNNADPKTISKLAEEVAALRTQMYKERMALDESLSKDVGIASNQDGMRGPRGGSGWHDGNRGGRGGHGGGHGGGRGGCNYGPNCAY